MIISDNSKPSLDEFKRLMASTDRLLNDDARKREDYYIGRSGHPIEKDVYEAVTECAKGTPFAGSIQLVSGASFPDIVAKKYYGIEVKSTNKNHWTSIGSSILESTRDQNVERIFLTFGKLGKPVQFLSRPYEDCLSGIAVTHYPRYQIDMRLGAGETIFDKMNIPYDVLRKMENPVAPVSQYYKAQLKPGESLWWAADEVETTTPATVRLWSTLHREEKDDLIIQGYALFPEIFSGQYDRFALWLVTAKGIVNTHIRDEFSAGGKVTMMTANGDEVRMPATFGKVEKFCDQIVEALNDTDSNILMEHWNCLELPSNRIIEWCNLVSRAAKTDQITTRSVLRKIFNV